MDKIRKLSLGLISRKLEFENRKLEFGIEKLDLVAFCLIFQHFYTERTFQDHVLSHDCSFARNVKIDGRPSVNAQQTLITQLMKRQQNPR